MANLGKVSKIYLVGIYGSGKSTLAKRLSILLKTKVYELDEIKYKRKYNVVRPVEERLDKIREISKKKSWVVEGTWTSYAIDLYKNADLVIFLQIPELILFKRIFLRYFKRLFSKVKYKDHNFKTTFKMMKNVHRYFHDSEYFLTFDSHKKYVEKYAKASFFIKSNKDIEKLLQTILF